MNTTIGDFSVGYFPPYKQYYISNGSDVYLNSSGGLGSIAYYDTEAEAAEALKGFKNDPRRKRL